MPFPSKICAAFCIGILLGLCLLDRPAYAQTEPTIDPILAAALTRKVELRDTTHEPYWISYADCIADDVLTFDVKVRNNTQQSQLEVWATVSSDCTVKDQRQGSSPGCWQVFSAQNTTLSQSVPIRVQTITAQQYGLAEDPAAVGTAASCEDGQRNQMTLYFMLIRAGEVQGTGATWAETALAHDLPGSPSGLVASAADNAVTLKWTASTDTNRKGYVYYCEEVGSDVAVSADGGVGDCGGTISSGERVVPGGNIYECGSTNSITATTASITELIKDGVPVPLRNGQPYAIGIAAQDAVQDVGKLSNVECVTPQITTDFFDAYRGAGGQAGGGICSVIPGGRPRSVGLPVLALASAVAAFGLRRRRSQRSF